MLFNFYLNEGSGEACTGHTKLHSEFSVGVNEGSIRLALLGAELPTGSKN